MKSTNRPRTFAGTPITSRAALAKDGHAGRDVASGKALAKQPGQTARVKIPKAKDHATLHAQASAGFIK